MSLLHRPAKLGLRIEKSIVKEQWRKQKGGPKLEVKAGAPAQSNGHPRSTKHQPVGGGECGFVQFSAHKNPQHGLWVSNK